MAKFCNRVHSVILSWRVREANFKELRTHLASIFAERFRNRFNRSMVTIFRLHIVRRSINRFYNFVTRYLANVYQGRKFLHLIRKRYVKNYEFVISSIVWKSCFFFDLKIEFIDCSAGYWLVERRIKILRKADSKFDGAKKRVDHPPRMRQVGHTTGEFELGRELVTGNFALQWSDLNLDNIESKIVVEIIEEYSSIRSMREIFAGGFLFLALYESRALLSWTIENYGGLPLPSLSIWITTM